jgi:COMM domain containing 2
LLIYDYDYDTNIYRNFFFFVFVFDFFDFFDFRLIMVQLHAPEKIKKDIEILKSIDEKLLAEFVKISVEFLQHGANRKKFVAAAKALQVSVAAVQASVEGLSWLLSECSRRLISERDFVDSFEALGFSEPFCQQLHSLYAVQREHIRRVLAERAFAVPSYDTLRWRMDVKLASRAVHHSADVVYLLELSLDNGERKHLLEADRANLIHVTKQLERALATFRSGHVNRIMRNIK